MFQSKKSDELPKKTVSKSLFSSQIANVRIDALYDDITENIWENPFVNSVNGHVPDRHAYEKEDKCMYKNYFLKLQLVFGVILDPLHFINSLKKSTMYIPWLEWLVHTS